MKGKLKMAKTKNVKKNDVVPPINENLQVVTYAGTPGAIAKPMVDIKVRSNITEKQIINAAVYKIERDLHRESDRLLKEETSLGKEYQSLTEELSKIKTEAVKKCKKDNCSTLLKQLESFTSLRLGIQSKFKDLTKDNKMRVSFNIVKYPYQGDSEYSQDTDFKKIVEIPAPKDLISKNKEIQDIQKKIAENYQNKNDNALRIKRLPSLRREIEATLTVAWLEGRINKTENVMQQLMQVIEESDVMVL